jgi:hypothetical protein
MHQTLVPQIHKTNISELKGTDRTRYGSCGKSQHCTLFSRQTSRKNQQRNPITKEYLGQNGLNRYL